jgi:hypothetical protein
VAHSTYVLGCEQNKLLVQAAHAFALALGKHLVSGHYQRVQVRYRATRGEDRITVGETNDLAHLLQDEMFHQYEDGRDLVCEPGVCLALSMPRVSIFRAELSSSGQKPDQEGTIYSHVCVCRGCKPFACQRNNVQPVAQLIEEMGMSCVCVA